MAKTVDCVWVVEHDEPGDTKWSHPQRWGVFCTAPEAAAAARECLVHLFDEYGDGCLSLGCRVVRYERGTLRVDAAKVVAAVESVLHSEPFKDVLAKLA